MRSIVELARSEVGDTRLMVHTFRGSRSVCHFHWDVDADKAKRITDKVMDLHAQDRVRFRPYQGWYVGWEAWID